MQKLIPAIVAASLMGSVAAFAQTTPSTPPANQGPSAVEKEKAPPASPSVTSESITLTGEQAKSWIDKVVYDSDGKKLGEVAAFARDGSSKVTEMHADMAASSVWARRAFV